MGAFGRGHEPSPSTLTTASRPPASGTTRPFQLHTEPLRPAEEDRACSHRVRGGSRTPHSRVPAPAWFPTWPRSPTRSRATRSSARQAYRTAERRNRRDRRLPLSAARALRRPSWPARSHSGFRRPENRVYRGWASCHRCCTRRRLNPRPHSSTSHSAATRSTRSPVVERATGTTSLRASGHRGWTASRNTCRPEARSNPRPAHIPYGSRVH
jgi:hypothetical protein